jgi:streptogramin lyase
MTPSGEVTMFDGSAAGVASPAHIVAGPDGNLWFTNAGNDSVGRITPSGDITVYAGSAAGSKSRAPSPSAPITACGSPT